MKNVTLDLSKSVASTFALTGFAVACVSGLLWQLSATASVGRGLLALAVCYVVGSIAGSILESMVRDHNATYERARPIPQLLRPGAVVAQSTSSSGAESGRTSDGGAVAPGGEGAKNV